MPNANTQVALTVQNARAAAKKKALLASSKSAWKKSELSHRAVSL